MKDGFLDEIKSLGYWRVNFQPTYPVYENKLTNSQCQSLMEECSVNLRGWDYPHIPRNDEYGKIESYNDYVEGWDDWGGHKEFWRMYRSSQFIDYRVFREDWGDEYRGRVQPMTVLSIVNTVYQVTEILTFLERLVEKEIYDEGIRFSLCLKNTANRQLFDLDPLIGIRTRGLTTSEPNIRIEKQYTKDVLSTSAMDIATQVSEEIFDKFCWTATPDVVEKIRDDLIYYRR